MAQESSPSQPTKKTPRAWVVVLVIAAAAVAAVVLAITQGSRNETANTLPNGNAAANANGQSIPSDWQTYTNTQYGYSLRVPPGWGAVNLSDDSCCSPLSASAADDYVVLNKPGSDTDGLLVHVYTAEPSSVDAYVRLYDNSAPISREEVPVGTTTMTLLRYPPASRGLARGNPYTFLVVHAGKLYELGATSLTTEITNIIQTFTLK